MLGKDNDLNFPLLESNDLAISAFMSRVLTLYYRIESEHNTKVIGWVTEEIPSGNYNRSDLNVSCVI